MLQFVTRDARCNICGLACEAGSGANVTLLHLLQCVWGVFFI
jgi:hypothetical protein